MNGFDHYYGPGMGPKKIENGREETWLAPFPGHAPVERIPGYENNVVKGALQGV